MSAPTVLDDLRWLCLIWQAKRWRDRLSFEARQRFDEQLRPPVGSRHPEWGQALIIYPDALYLISAADLRRAKAVSTERDR